MVLESHILSKLRDSGFAARSNINSGDRNNNKGG